MIQMASSVAIEGVNPLQSVIDAYLRGDPSEIFELTLASSKEGKFGNAEALHFVRGLQGAMKCGTLPTRHAHSIAQTLIQLETSNTPAKYLIDQLLISLACE